MAHSAIAEGATKPMVVCRMASASSYAGRDFEAAARERFGATILRAIRIALVADNQLAAVQADLKQAQRDVALLLGATTCTVAGLHNGTTYTFTVTATNRAGPSSASAPSAAVSPRAAGAVLRPVLTEAGRAWERCVDTDSAPRRPAVRGAP